MILDEIVAYKKEELIRQKRENSLSDLKSRLPKPASLRNFKKAISNPDKTNLIAEIKKASPSAGIIKKEFYPIEIARIYASSGASAISVITDKKFFQGSINLLSQIRPEVNLPLFRKDFIIDEYQVYESLLKGADAILLIASILDKKKMDELISLSNSLGLDFIIEVHNLDELNRALATNAEIIGINNRDLHTFEVDLGTTYELMKHIPPDRIVVSESGIKSRDDILSLKKSGVNAFLVGEALIKEDSISRKIKEMVR